MLVTFRTKVHADILMFGEIAVQLLKLMGHSGAAPGAILADDVPAALNRLQTAVAAQPTMVPKAANAAEEDEDENESPVDLAHRAFPLIELLTAAIAAHCDVMWDR